MDLGQFRAALGPDVRTCAWDYFGGGHSTGAPMMTAARAASSLHGTLRAAKVPRPVMLVGHSIAGITTRLYVGEHPADVAGVVLFDSGRLVRPPVRRQRIPAWLGRDGQCRPGGAGHHVAGHPFEILRHDPAVYATRNVWSDTVEARWGAEQIAFATLAPKGTARVVQGSGHNVYQGSRAVSVAAVRRVLAAVVTKH